MKRQDVAFILLGAAALACGAFFFALKPRVSQFVLRNDHDVAFDYMLLHDGKGGEMSFTPVAEIQPGAQEMVSSPGNVYCFFVINRTRPATTARFELKAGARPIRTAELSDFFETQDRCPYGMTFPVDQR